MICDNCALKDICLIRPKMGRHEAKCKDYFPDLNHAKPQRMGRFATLEKRLQKNKRGD